MLRALLGRHQQGEKAKGEKNKHEPERELNVWYDKSPISFGREGKRREGERDKENGSGNAQGLIPEGKLAWQADMKDGTDEPDQQDGVKQRKDDQACVFPVSHFSLG